MSDCPSFEIRIDQRLCGALSDEQARGLDAHLATCEACRSYEEAARSMQLGLGAAASEAHARVDWDRVERGIRDRLRARTRSLWVGALIGVAAVALSTWGFGEPGARFWLGLEIGALVGAVVLGRALFVVREVRAIAQLERGDELIARHRAMLAKRERQIRTFRWLALAVVVWSVVNAVLASNVRHVIVHFGLGALVAAAWIHTLLVVHPRIRRELADLERTGPR